MVDVSNIFYPTLTLPLQREGTGFLLFPPFTRGKGGSNVMKITEYHFSNILLETIWQTLRQVRACTAVGLKMVVSSIVT